MSMYGSHTFVLVLNIAKTYYMRLIDSYDDESYDNEGNNDSYDDDGKNDCD